MQVSAIDSLKNYLTSEIKGTAQTDRTTAFDSVLKAAMNTFNETNALQKEAEKAELDYALGYIDIADANIAAEKALIAMQFTLEIRDKVLEAYNEIMRIQM